MQIETARLEDVYEIMDWFPDKDSVIRWGSPYTRYPLTRETLLEDIYWDRLDSRVARTGDGELLAFGQFYLKLGRCHLARLVVNPSFRGKGLGEDFTAALMKHGGEKLDTDTFSLYVMTANKPAVNCYKRLGFNLAPYPDGDARLENCVFMVAEQSGS